MAGEIGEVSRQGAASQGTVSPPSLREAGCRNTLLTQKPPRYTHRGGLASPRIGVETKGAQSSGESGLALASAAGPAPEKAAATGSAAVDPSAAGPAAAINDDCAGLSHEHRLSPNHDSPQYHSK